MGDREKQVEQLLDQLWPTPAPRPDLAARVLAGLEQSGDSLPQRLGPRACPPLPPPTVGRPAKRRGRVLALALPLAAAAGFALWWTQLRVPEITAQGQQLARERVTVSIAD